MSMHLFLFDYTVPGTLCWYVLLVPSYWTTHMTQMDDGNIHFDRTNFKISYHNLVNTWYKPLQPS